MQVRTPRRPGLFRSTRHGWENTEPGRGLQGFRVMRVRGKERLRVEAIGFDSTYHRLSSSNVDVHLIIRVVIKKPPRPKISRFA